jgi:hypothetical protein
MNYKQVCTPRRALMGAAAFLTLFFTQIVHAQTWEGGSGNSAVVKIENNYQGTAELTITQFSPNGTTITKEKWIYNTISKGFSVTAPEGSALKKTGVKVEYERLSNTSKALGCKIGCGSTVPNVIASK